MEEKLKYEIKEEECYWNGRIYLFSAKREGDLFNNYTITIQPSSIQHFYRQLVKFSVLIGEDKKFLVFGSLYDLVKTCSDNIATKILEIKEVDDICEVVLKRDNKEFFFH